MTSPLPPLDAKPVAPEKSGFSAPIIAHWKGRAQSAEHALGHEIAIKSEAIADLRASESRCAALMAALKPFADAAKDCDVEDVRDGADAWESGMAMSVTFGDFRRARAALEAQERTA